MGDMFPPNQGSNLFQDSTLNITHRENCCISGYKGPNDIFQDGPNMEWTLLSMVKFSYLDDETRTHGSSYKFAMLNSPQKSHLGNLTISTTWRIHFYSTQWGSK